MSFKDISYYQLSHSPNESVVPETEQPSLHYNQPCYTNKIKLLMFKRLLAETKSMQQSSRPVSPLRSTTPSRYPVDLHPTRKDITIRSPLRERECDFRQANQYLHNHLQRKCTSPIRQPSPLTRKNTQPVPNSQSPLKNALNSDLGGYQKGFGRAPESCCIPLSTVDESYQKENVKNNFQLFTMLVKDQNVRSDTSSNIRMHKQKSLLTFTQILKKQHSLVQKVQKDDGEYSTHNTNQKAKEKQKGSVTTMDFSSSKKLSFKDSLKLATVEESIKHSVVLEKKVTLRDSVGSISLHDRVNESAIDDSIMDLNMDPCFDM